MSPGQEHCARSVSQCGSPSSTLQQQDGVNIPQVLGAAAPAKLCPRTVPKSLILTPVVHAANHSRFSLLEEKELPDICSGSCGKPIILEGKLSADNWKYRLLTDGVLTKLQLLLRWCHIESQKPLVMFSRCIILSHPDRYHGSAPNWKPGL